MLFSYSAVGMKKGIEKKKRNWIIHKVQTQWDESEIRMSAWHCRKATGKKRHQRGNYLMHVTHWKVQTHANWPARKMSHADQHLEMLYSFKKVKQGLRKRVWGLRIGFPLPVHTSLLSNHFFPTSQTHPASSHSGQVQQHAGQLH